MKRKLGAWFDVDKEGLAKVLARRGKGFVVTELIQNAYDSWPIPPTAVLLVGDTGGIPHWVGIGADSPATFTSLVLWHAASARSFGSASKERMRAKSRTSRWICDST
ncbi:MAG: hypothetical protein ABIN58_09140 [candidate division WOR-3 bacterium]